MTRRIVVRPAVSFDVDDHVAYLSEQNEDRAFRFFDAVRETFADLARMPGMGVRYRHPTRADLNLHKWSVKGFRSYLVFYKIHETEVEIVRIISAARDIDQIFS
jgi:toxin ParE1/3/4